ncbi:hypothetical protein [Aquirufa rosea]|uniref:Uncharacterized protein n=1 Tax=Aquirufa rosea TaxID=2509241 RepID=A0A4V1M5G7_9BACT|nr:hypothetical protein [Aquirufa rosea]RXK49654.1 hypothetical protein ESB04_05625 [Aquirufa rosea]
MTQNFTPNDLVKNLYEPKKGQTSVLTWEDQLELASLQKVKLSLDNALLEPPSRAIEAILAYSKHQMPIQS